MIDIHNHVLFGIDDGSPDIEYSIEMIKKAIVDGITEMILTPHYIHGEYYSADAEKTSELFRLLNERVEAEGLKIKLHLGNELFIHKDLDTFIEEGKVHTLAGSHYVLVEFPMNKYRDEYDDYLYNITVSGCGIIIAHPERYLYVQEDPHFVMRWIDEGYYLQSNADSLFARRKFKVMKTLLDRDLIDFIASDAHDTENRPPVLSKAYREIAKLYSFQTAERLFVSNPETLLEKE